MRYNIPSDNCTLRSVKALNDPYGSNGSLNLLPPHHKHKMFFFLTLANEIQYTIRQLNSTERKCTRQSVRIERIVKPSAPLTIIKGSSFSQVSPMGCNIPSVNCTLRSEKALNDPYKSNGSISLLHPSPSTKDDFFSKSP